MESWGSEHDAADAAVASRRAPLVTSHLLGRIACAVLVVLLLALLVVASIDFLPPLHYAVVYNWLAPSYAEGAHSVAGMYWIGPFNTLRLVPSTVQTLLFNDDSEDGLGSIQARADNGLPVHLEVTIVWKYDVVKLPNLLASVESILPTEDAPRLYMPATKLVRSLSVSSLCLAAAHYSPHDFFAYKQRISADFAASVEAALPPYVSLASVQFHRVLVPSEFENAMLTSVITRLQTLEAERFKSVRAVMLRTLALAARYNGVQRVTRAHGEASVKRQRGISLATQVAQTVGKEIEAFANVSQRMGDVTPHQVLDYAYWQLFVGDDAELARRKPLHDILLARPTHQSG